MDNKQQISHANTSNSDFTSSIHFSEHTERVNYSAFHYLAEAVDNIEVEQGSPFVIFEYGAGTGSGSIEAYTKLIGKIRGKYGPDQEITIVYSDILHTDFNELFRFLNKRTIPNQSIFNGVHFMATAKSFFAKCCTDKMVHLGFSSFALQYLSDPPRNMKPLEERWSCSLWSEQAAEDWEKILLLRARELKAGGRMVFQMAGRTDDNQSGGFTATIPTVFYRNLNAIMKEMLTEGKITKEECLENLPTNTYPRSMDEINQPFGNESSAVYKAGLRLDHVDIQIVRCPFNLRWTDKSFDKDEIKESVKQYVSGVRTWNEVAWRSPLSSKRSEAEKTKIMDELYGRYEAQILENPKLHGYDIVNGLVCISKIK